MNEQGLFVVSITYNTVHYNYRPIKSSHHYIFIIIIIINNNTKHIFSKIFSNTIVIRVFT